MNVQLLFVVLSLFGTLLFSSSSIQATPETAKVEYTDFLPKYRTLSNNFLISKIAYTKDDIILYFRHVVEEDKDDVAFFGVLHVQAWKLTTGTRAEYRVTRSAVVRNIRLNDEMQAEYLSSKEQKRIQGNAGDIITCEIHFPKMPYSIRTVHLEGGERIENSERLRFACNDILLKTKESKQLGSQEQMNSIIKHFYARQPMVNYPDIATVTTIDEDKKLSKNKATSSSKANRPLANALEPIDYMPKSLRQMDDLVCNERIILTNVYFHDNRAEFSGRVKAMRTLNILIDYLSFYPKTKVVLHGHTDIFGNSFQNLELSKKRVLAVKRVLAAKGIDTNRIITVHHGGAQPLIQYKNGGALNRRVEVELVCSKTKETKNTAQATPVNN